MAKSSPDEKNMLMKKLLTNCVLDGEVLKYEIKSPFDKLLSCTNYKKWQDIALENLDEFGEVGFEVISKCFVSELLWIYLISFKMFVKYLRLKK